MGATCRFVSALSWYSFCLRKAAAEKARYFYRTIRRLRIPHHPFPPFLLLN
jgi:hypothetical protein